MRCSTHEGPVVFVLYIVSFVNVFQCTHMRLLDYL